MDSYYYYDYKTKRDEALKNLMAFPKPQFVMADFIRTIGKAKLVMKMAGDRTKTYFKVKTKWGKDPNTGEYGSYKVKRLRDDLEQDMALLGTLLPRISREGIYIDPYRGFTNTNEAMSAYRFIDLTKYFKGFMPGLTQEKARQTYRHYHLLKEYRYRLGALEKEGQRRLVYLSRKTQEAIGKMVKDYVRAPVEGNAYRPAVPGGLGVRFVQSKVPGVEYKLLRMVFNSLRVAVPQKGWEGNTPETEHKTAISEELIRMAQEKHPDRPPKVAFASHYYVFRDRTFSEIYAIAKDRALKWRKKVQYELFSGNKA